MTDRVAILVRLARLAAADAARKHLPQRLCDASRLVLGADGAWVTVHNTAGNPTTLGSTDRVAARLEELQEVLGEGPCRAAFDERHSVTARITEQPGSRWPEFRRAAWQSVGPVTVHAFPMRPGGHTFGVLGVYSVQDTGLLEPAEAQFVADAVGAALLRDPPSADGPDESGMPSARAVVHRATGMVIAQLNLRPEDALAILRAHAYAHDATLADVAHQVVQRRLDFRTEP